MEPVGIARPSAIDGRDGLREGSVGVIWVNRRALLASSSLTPPLRLVDTAHCAATSRQSWFVTPLVASGWDLL